MIPAHEPSPLVAGTTTMPEPDDSDASTLRRRHDDPGGPTPTAGRWPLDVHDGYARGVPRDSWAALVRASIEDYRNGHPDRARAIWDPDITWKVDGDGPMSAVLVGADEIFAYHREVLRRTDGTFRQELVALLSSGGPLVEAHVRTTAQRGPHRLDIPTLIVFELGGARLRKLTELPGDQAAWDAFWGD